jgi:S1-C subfamily serine protease
MKYFFGLVSLMLVVSSLSAQTIRVKFRINPSKAVITIDGEEYNKSHSDYIAMGFNARKGITEHEIIISASGFENKTYTFDQSSPRSQVISVELNRVVPKFETKSNPIFAFEKVISGIEYNTSIGAEYRWKYDNKEEINLGERKAKIEEALSKAGLGASDEQEVEDLFGTAKKSTKKRGTDILIAGKVLDFKLAKQSEGGFFSASSSSYTATVKINWQFLDVHTKEIVYKASHTSAYPFQSSSTSTTLSEFFNSISENFYDLIVTDKEFKQLIENYEPDVNTIPVESTGNADTALAAEALKTITFIDPVDLPKVEGFEDLVKAAMKASVTVISQDKSHGSGVVVSKGGYIVTNHHVVDTSKTIEIQFSNGMILTGDVLGSSEKYDLALIKVNVSGLTALPISMTTSTVEIGEEVFAVGAPGDSELGQSVTKGIVSGKRVLEDVKAFQTDTKVSPGNSGSPLINMKGEVIGIINMKLIGEGIEGISFAVDAKYIFNVLGISYE